jgi:hypothetical protein
VSERQVQPNVIIQNLVVEACRGRINCSFGGTCNTASSKGSDFERWYHQRLFWMIDCLYDESTPSTAYPYIVLKEEGTEGISCDRIRSELLMLQ